ncbi:core-2/I-branching enzyme-domain-containing protein [Obelidium mucronatum]|nr:core-2/I-branching enzyme-domain-containing protein [Obelidium mucronatum]
MRRTLSVAFLLITAVIAFKLLKRTPHSAVVFDSRIDALKDDLALNADRGIAGSPSNLHFRVTGFDYCHYLNNAVFNLGHCQAERISTINPSESEFVSFLDEKARNITDYLLNVHPDTFSEETTKRFACFATAEGSNMLANLSDERLLHRIDAVSYFQDLLPAVKSDVRYRIAYLIMAHGHVFEQLVNLIEELNDGSAVFLLHVDANENSMELQTSLEAMAANHQGFNSVNVFLAKTRFKISWGHASIMWMQLNGFWELLDLAEWDHLITLSAHDYPLRKSREIARILHQDKYVGSNFIKHWSHDVAHAKRLLPNLHMKNPQFLEITGHHLDQIGMMAPPFPRWAYVKHHQWLILTSDFVEYTRNSPEVAHAFAFFEHTLVPDESFLGTVLKNTENFRHRLVDGKRFIKFKKNSPHPEWLTLKDISNIGTDDGATDPNYFFVRKIDTNTSLGLALVKWIQSEHIMKHLLPKDDYKEFISL